MPNAVFLNPVTVLKRLRLPDTSAEEFGQRGISARIVHLVAPLTMGESKLVVNGRLVHEGPLAPGMLRLCNPADKEQRLVNKPVEVMVFTLPFTHFESICADQHCPLTSTDHSLSESHLIKHRLVQQLTTTALLADDLVSEAKTVFVGGIAEALVGVLIDQHKRAGDADATEGRRGLSSRQLRDCIAFADEHLGQKLSVADWADIARLSASEFGRRFQASTKLTPYAWYINRRIVRAQEMLQKRSTVISDLALALGFASQSHFTEAFRRRTGMSPARWRSLRKDFDSVAVS